MQETSRDTRNMYELQKLGMQGVRPRLPPRELVMSLQSLKTMKN
jgi:hypothetical protein